MEAAQLGGLSLKGKLTFLFSDSAVYGAAAAAGKAVSLFTFPLLARRLSVTDYGVLDFLSVLTGFLTLFLVFGQDSAVARYFYDAESNAARRQLASQSLAAQLFCAFLILPCLWFAAKHFALRQNIGGAEVAAVLLQAPFFLILNFSQNILKWTLRRRSFLALTLGYTVVYGIAVGGAVLAFGVGIQVILFIGVGVSALFAMLGLYFVREHLAFPTDMKMWRKTIPFAVPCGLTCLAGAFASPMERILVERTLGVEQLGMYAAGSKVALLLTFVVSAFQNAWGPFSLALSKHGSACATYNMVLRIVAVVLCLVVLILSATAEFIVRLLASEKYLGSAVIVFPLAMAFVVQAISWVMEIGITISKRSLLSFAGYLIYVISAAVGIVLFSQKLGLLGVALGVLTAHVVRAVVCFRFAQAVHPLSWDFWPVGCIMAVTVICGLVAAIARHQLGHLSSICTYVAGICLIVVYYWTSVLTPAERGRLSAKLQSLAGR